MKIIKQIKQSVPFVVAMLFIVPFAVWAQSSFPTSPLYPVYKSDEFKNNWVLQDGKGNTINASGPAFWVLRNSTFSMSWDSEGKLEKNDQLSSDGIFCRKSWSSSPDASGSITGVISDDLTFYMTCAGLGGGQKSYRPVKVGDIDLSVKSVSVAGYSGSESNSIRAGSFDITASIENSGNFPVDTTPFIVQYSLGNTEQGPFATILGEQTVASGVTAGNTISLAPLKKTSVASLSKYWFRVCVDTANVIREKDDGKVPNNNCKIGGPYTFVE